MFEDKFVLLCDMDDVLENLTDVWLKMLDDLQQHNPDYKSLKYNDHKTWDIVSEFPMLSIDEIFEPLNMPIIWDEIRPIQGAFEVLEKFNKDPRVILRFSTASHHSAITGKRKFMDLYYPYIKWNQFIVIRDKQLLYGDVLVDDYPGNLINAHYKGIIFEQPWNKSFDEKANGMYRAKNWNEVEKIIDQMILEKCGTVEEWLARNLQKDS